jgi:hypothetical protein
MSNNSNCTLVFYFGVTILSLVLLLAIAPIQQQFLVLAQDEDEKEEEEEEQEEQQEEQDSGSGGDDNSKDEEQEQEEEQPQEEQGTPIEEVQTPEPQPLINFTNDHLLNTVEPVQNTAVETATPPIEEFNATCSCYTNNNNLSTPPPTPPQQPSAQSPIPITSTNIVDSNSLGQIKDGNYTGYYTVANLLDNKIDDTSFWSQAGNSGFTIQFDNVLDGYQVCSMELNNIHDPKGVPYFLDIGVSKNYTGVIDQVNEQIPFDKCVRDMNQIVMMFNKDNPQSVDFISIGEIKLFGSKIGAEETPTTIIPPVLEPVQEKPVTTTIPEYENATKINIQDSTAEINIKNSTVTFKFDPMTATFVQQ